jgi:hypothetical protein
MLPRTMLHIWLAFLLLFAQQGAVLHALSHLPGPFPAQSQPDKQLPHSQVCDKCVVYGQLGAGVAATPLVIFGQHAAVALVAALFAIHFASPLRAYFSRAPPRLV